MVDKEKRLIDFLHVLLRLTEENIKFMCGNVTYKIFELDKYKEILSIPGIEITTKEGTHVIIYFFEIDSLKDFKRRNVYI